MVRRKSVAFQAFSATIPNSLKIVVHHNSINQSKFLSVNKHQAAVAPFCNPDCLINSLALLQRGEKQRALMTLSELCASQLFCHAAETTFQFADV